MINSVSFQGANPTAETQQKKKSYAVPGLILGAAGGAGVSLLTDLGKKPKFENVDSFISSSDASKLLDDIKDDGVKDDVAALKTAKEDAEKAGTAAEEKVKKMFPDENTKEVEISKVLDEVDGKPKLDDLKAVLDEKVGQGIGQKSEDLKKLQDAAAKFEAKKAGSEIIGEQAKDKEVVKVFQEEGENKPVMMQKGKMVENAEKKLEFKALEGDAGKAVELKTHAEAFAKEEGSFKLKKSLVDALGVTKDTAADAKVNKEQTQKAFSSAAKSTLKNAEAAFDKIKSHLPKELSHKMVALYTAGGAVIAGIIGYMIKKKEN